MFYIYFYKCDLQFISSQLPTWAHMLYPRVRDARAQDGAIKCFMIILTIDDIMIETFLDLHGVGIW